MTRPVLEGVRGADLLIGECNYDLDMLRSGTYPAYLKERILSERGHLSNEMGGKLAAWAAQNGTRRVVLAHLSKENNRPDLALEVVRREMTAVGADAELCAAPRGHCSGWMEV